MIDGSHHSFEDNIALTKKVVEYAHSKGVVVEGELGQLAGIEDDVKVSDADASYTPSGRGRGVCIPHRRGFPGNRYRNQPRRFQVQTRPETPASLRHSGRSFQETARIPHVLHGASSVSQEYVKIIQENGGNLADAIGIPEDMLRRAAKSAVCKINIDSDLRLAMTAGVRQVLFNKPEVFDPREYLKVGRQYVKDLVAHKITEGTGKRRKSLNRTKSRSLK